MTSPSQRKFVGKTYGLFGSGGRESLLQNSFTWFVARVYVNNLSVDPSAKRSSYIPFHVRVVVDVSDGFVRTSAWMSVVHAPPTPSIATAPRPPRPPPRPPPGNPACSTGAPPGAPRPLPRPPRPLPPLPPFAEGFIAADPAAPTMPTTVVPNGEPGRRVKARRFPSGDHVGAASRSTPGNG